MESNVLYYGDNLDILRRYLPDESVDLVYLDPPFNSNRDYNVIFKDQSGRSSDAQILAFEDTWNWGPSAEEAYAYLTNTSRHQGRIPDRVSALASALRSNLRENQMLAYLVEMTTRLNELHRVLKPTGSLYLHCDPTASHYLRVIMDSIFGPTNFVNEVIWKRSDAHNDYGQGAKHLGRIHDVILFYRKTEEATFHPLYTPLPDKTVEKWYRHVEPETGRRYNLADMTGPGGAAKGNPQYEFLGVTRYWRYSKQRMQELFDQGLIVQSKPGTVPARKRYLDESKGVALQDMWSDIDMLRGMTKGERLGYPTQKPLALLERIIAVSSNPGDVVLDPFCGCGTALIAAQSLERRWIGVDITYLAVAVMRSRLHDSFGLDDIPVVGQPTELEGARQLAQSPDGRYQFQWWALGLIDARPVGGVEKKGADRGIDGRITFTNELGELESVLVSVKSGHVNASMVRDLKGTLDREKASIGVLLTLEEPTKEMRLEASTAGLYHSALWNRDYPKIQVLTIREVLEDHQRPDLPAFRMPTYEGAKRLDRLAEQGSLFGKTPEQGTSDREAPEGIDS
jgi:DNA modification methylase